MSNKLLFLLQYLKKALTCPKFGDFSSTQGYMALTVCLKIVVSPVMSQAEYKATLRQWRNGVYFEVLKNLFRHYMSL